MKPDSYWPKKYKKRALKNCNKNKITLDILVKLEKIEKSKI